MLTFKTPTLNTEFTELKQKNFALAQLTLDLADFVQYEFRKDVIVTAVFRTKAEQERIYGKGTKRKSPHMTWKAVDIRDWIYSKEEKAKIIAHLKSNYDESNLLTYIQAAKSKTVWLHAVGKHGMHFHIQYSGPLIYVFSEPMVVTA